MSQSINTPHRGRITHRQSQAAAGALVGAAVGDALGAGFEFKPRGSYKASFPEPVIGSTGEMVGGGPFGWKPGEFTDDTQMALALAESLLANHMEFDPAFTWSYFTAWARSAADIGKITRVALGHSDYTAAAEKAHNQLGQSGGNGSVMRIAPIGIAGVRWGHRKTIEVARTQSALTHFDQGAGWGAAIVAELIRRIILGETLDVALEDITLFLDEPHRSDFEAWLNPQFSPFDDHSMGNGAVWMCIAQAIWAVRTTDSFETAVTAAINLGDDADTVGAVTGAIAGAMYGIQQIPSRWTTYLNGTIARPSGEVKGYSLQDLQNIASQLILKRIQPEDRPEAAVPPKQVHPAGVYAANIEGAALADQDMAIVSLCRTGDRFINHPFRRQVYLVDKAGDRNPSLLHAVTDAVTAIEQFLDEGREVVVHCFGGRSRTGLVLKAWYMRHHKVGHDEAHDWVQSIWPPYATWTQNFTDFLNNTWPKYIKQI